MRVPALDRHGHAACRAACRRRSTTRIAKLPIPKVMTYQRADGATSSSSGRRIGCSRCTAPTIVPVTRARPRRRPHDRRPPLPRPPRHRRRDRGRLRGNARRRGQGDRELRRAARADRRPRSRTARRTARPCIMPDALLDEVTALVEWPAVYAGTFDPAFLAVPQECLILTMQQNQKYFALADAEGKLANRFLIVSNIETADPAAIVAGQRARAARAARGRAVLLRPGPQDAARSARAEARAASSITTSSARSSSASSACAAWPATSPR